MERPEEPPVEGEVARKVGQGCRVNSLRNARMCDETGLSQAHPSVPHGSLRLTRMCGDSRDRGQGTRWEVMGQPLCLNTWF